MVHPLLSFSFHYLTYKFQALGITPNKNDTHVVACTMTGRFVPMKLACNYKQACKITNVKHLSCYCGGVMACALTSGEFETLYDIRFFVVIRGFKSKCNCSLRKL